MVRACRRGAKWFREAAAQGEVNSQYYLGLLHYDGTGVPQDHAEAAKWFRAAAEQGHAEAQRWLSIMYFGGKGVPQNYREAYAWANIAAARGAEHAKQLRDSIAQELSPADLSAAQELAKEYFRRY